MKKATINEYRLNELIGLLLEAYPPNTEKNITMAFKDYVNEFPETITYVEWLGIYTKNKTPEAIAQNILKALEFRPRRRVINNFGGWGGQRGISKDWIIYEWAVMLLFIPEKCLKRFRLDIDLIEFLALIKLKSMGKPLNTVSLETKRAIDFSIDVLICVMRDFLNNYNITKPKYLAAVKHFFGEDSSFTANIKTRGKHVSKQTLKDAIRKVCFHVGRLDKSRKPQKFYTEDRFYFLAWLASKIIRFLNLDTRVQVDKAIETIQNVLVPFSEDEKKKILSVFIRKEFPPLTPPPLKNNSVNLSTIL